jgi:hypothetical membrane protein
VDPGLARADLGEPRPALSPVRVAALGGMVGPVAFILVWGVASNVEAGYSARDDAISELAAIGADTRALMTTGFVVFALCVVPYAIALRRALGGPAWITAAGTGIATLAVAAIPLGRSTSTDHLHGTVAVVGYTALAVTPLLAIRPLLNRGNRGAARLSLVTAMVSGSALLLSDATSLTGLFQRIGLTAGQAWIVGSALAMALGRLPTTQSERRVVASVATDATVAADATV